jgi:GDPmannose 4,6-dehydratase
MEKKIVDSMVDISLGILDSFQLGNLNAQRDIGHAREYVDGMWRMLQRETPEDYVLSTGKTHTVREIVNKTAFLLGMDIKWEGEGINEICLYQGKKIISIDSKYFRPAEVDLLIGDSSKARNELGWESKMTIYDILKEMIDFQIHKRKP